MKSARENTMKQMEEKSEDLEKRDLVCFSHLRWDWVFQRPQHLMTRAARDWRVFYVEEPRVEEGKPRLEVITDPSGVIVVKPHFPPTPKEEARAAHIALIEDLIRSYRIEDAVFWYYTPMALDYTRSLRSRFCVYDCMDDLSSFNGAPKKLADLEKELLAKANVVFTGGRSLYEAKKPHHRHVYAFPSSIDRAHFARARTLGVEDDPSDQKAIPHPRLGYFGVIDERMDLALVAGIADARPEWQIMMVGPVAKLEQYHLPRRPNIHYLGIKDYQDLPSYLAGWDVAIMPFANNQATRYISPTKTPEYLAGGKPVVSTPVRDVVVPYGEQGLVWIAENVAQFVEAAQAALNFNGNRARWLEQVDEFLAGNSWDKTWQEMNDLIVAGMDGKLRSAATNGNGASKSLRDGSQKPAAVSQASVMSSVGATSIAEQTSRVQSALGPPGLKSSAKPASSMDLSSSTPSSLDEGTPKLAIPLIPGPKRRRGRGSYDFLIVGAGFAGSVLAERLARGSGKKVLIIDKRNHIAGNAYDRHDTAGVLIHQYGPHIFHTNSREIFAYLSRFTEWRPYEHRVRASVDGQLVPIPINLDTINQLYGLNLDSAGLQRYFETVAEKVENITTSEDVVVSKVGRELYEKFFRNYTRKQWGLDPSELDATVTSRVPTRLNRDDRYFGDTYQSMPVHGYTRMFENMLDHSNIHIMLNTDYHDIVDTIPYDKMVFTGPIDEFFDYRYGKLPYRSLQFKFETLEREWLQPVAVINYPNEHVYTRCTEFKHLTGQAHNKTSVVYEFPCSEGDPYYPIPKPENGELYRKYKALADATEGVFFCGRLATYRYYNMDQVTGQALTLYSRLAGVNRNESAYEYARQTFPIEIPCTLMASQEAF